jgi:hypothetical protein
VRILGLDGGSQSEEQAHPTYDCSHRDHLFHYIFCAKQYPTTLTRLAKRLFRAVAGVVFI